MNRILYTGRTGLESMQTKMDTIAHNIANVQTIGYKNMEVQFEDLVYDQTANRGIPLTEKAGGKPIEIGTGSKVRSIMHRFSQGPLQETSNPLDLAVKGEGFFGVEDKNGEILLTRDGAFTLDGNGRLVDSSGNRLLLDLYLPISQYSENELIINENGVLTGLNKAGEYDEVGRVLLFDVSDKARLKSIGGNYFSAAEQAEILPLEDQTEASKILQGYLEGPFVDITEELTEMFITQRAYSINTRSINAADDMWSMVNQLRR